MLPETCAQMFAMLPISPARASSSVSVDEEENAGVPDIPSGFRRIMAETSEPGSAPLGETRDDWAGMMMCCRPENRLYATGWEIQGDSSELQEFQDAVAAGLESNFRSGEDATRMKPANRQVGPRNSMHKTRTKQIW